jgi:hypothetical protein
MRTSYPGLRVDGSSPSADVARVVNGVLAGRQNVLLELDIAADATSTQVLDARLTETVLPVAVLGSSVTGYAWLGEALARFDHAAGAARVEAVLLWEGGGG